LPITTLATSSVTVTAAPVMSHFSCCRRSPDERHQLSTWRPTELTANSSSARKTSAATTPAGLE
jgi:hypothetical protein